MLPGHVTAEDVARLLMVEAKAEKACSAWRAWRVSEKREGDDWSVSSHVEAWDRLYREMDALAGEIEDVGGEA
jgi:hypothetical protein